MGFAWLSKFYLANKTDNVYDWKTFILPGFCLYCVRDGSTDVLSFDASEISKNCVPCLEYLLKLSQYSRYDKNHECRIHECLLNVL